MTLFLHLTRSPINAGGFLAFSVTETWHYRSNQYCGLMQTSKASSNKAKTKRILHAFEQLQLFRNLTTSFAGSFCLKT